MREVLFRGKSLRYGKWVYGSYIQITEPAGSVYHSIFHPRDGVTEGDEPVDPETVGQWTGLTDCKGVRIFEGDLIRHQGAVYRVRYLSDMTRFAAVRPNGTFEPAALADCEVIGNVYDNPELLEY